MSLTTHELGRMQAVSGGCSAYEETIYTWAEALQCPEVPLFSPTDESWNPFQGTRFSGFAYARFDAPISTWTEPLVLSPPPDSSCNSSVTCSYGLGDGSCRLYRSRTFCNGPLRRDTLARLAQAFAERADDDGRTAERFEIIYLTGWAPAPSQPQPARRGSATTSLAAALKPTGG